jgi:branched-chain amino acid transport system substrate-binding protein
MRGSGESQGETTPAGGGPAGGGPTPSTGGDTVLIGEYGSMTGSEATFGLSTHRGILLAISERNAKGGVKGKRVALQHYDDQGKSQEAGTAVTRLITSDKVVAIIGEVASSLSIAGGRVAQQFGVPMISPSSTNARVTQIGNMVSRVCFIDSFQGYVVARFVRENLKLTKVAVLYDQGQAYSKGLKDDFAKAFQSMGGSLTSEQAYTGGDADFSAQLTSIRATEPEAIFLPGYYTDAGTIALQARKLGITVPFLGGDGWDSAKLAEIGGAAIEGSYYSNHYSHEEERPEVVEFVKRYQEEYQVVPDGLAALGYDAARLLFDAMDRAATWDGPTLAAAINASRNFAGVTGKISIDENRNAKKAAVILQMKGGAPRFVASIHPP